MPGDLEDPAQFFPFHYDRRYDPGDPRFPGRSYSPEDVIQSTAVRELGHALSLEQLDTIKRKLIGKGYLRRNWGSEEFQDEVKRNLEIYKQAERVIHAFRS